MANYETLADGGHEHLIATVKPLVDQKANEHDIDVSVKELVENQPRGQLTGEILSTSHAYDMPPVSVTVDGKSTQVTTTGKNLLDYNLLFGTPTVAGDYFSTYNLDFPAGTYTLSCNYGNSAGVAPYGIDGTSMTEGESACYYNHPVTFTVAEGQSIIIRRRNRGGSYVPTKALHDNGTIRLQLELSSAATTYEPYTGGKPSPSPDCPQEIVSVENPAVRFAGENLFDGQMELGKLDTTTGALEPSTNNLRSMHGIPVAALNSYYCYVGSAGVVAGYMVACYYDTDFRFVAYRSIKSNDVFVVPADAKWMRFFVSASYGTEYKDDICISLSGADDGTYQPTATTVTFPVTLRSLPDGTHDTLALSYLRPSEREGWAWYSRELVQRCDIADLGALTWSQYTYSDHLVFRTARLTTSRSGFCTDLTTSETNVPAALPDNSICLYTKGWSANGNMMARADAYGSASAFKAAMDGVMAQYKLATPVTTTLDPIELPHMPLGDVTIWSDPTTGLTVNYIVEGKTIEATLETGIANALAAIATVETSPTTYNHAVGSRIVYDEVLYRVTSAIASGEDIVPGTNVEATTVADEIKRLQQ